MFLLSESEILAVGTAYTALKEKHLVLTFIPPLTCCVTLGKFPHLSVLKLAQVYRSHRIQHGVKTELAQGTWVAQSVERPTPAQVTVSRSVRLSPASGSVLTAQRLEPVSDSVSPSLRPFPARALSLSVCLSNMNKH